MAEVTDAAEESGVSTSSARPSATEPQAPLREGKALVRACRPRQWLKNVFVAAAPIAAGALLEADVLVGTLVAFVVFCAAASSIYLLNDLLDVEADRRHPTKCRRPIAAGELNATVAQVAGLLLGAVALGAAWWWSAGLGAVIAAYMGVQVLYCLGLKHQPGVDLLVVSSGFLLRVVAGGVASAIYLSPPFLVVVAAGSLFMVAGKRHSELVTVGTAAGTRRSLQHYSASWLQTTWIMAGVVTVVAYVVASTRFAPPDTDGSLLASVSVLPFLLGILRYATHIKRGEAGAPENVVLADRALRLLGVCWFVPVILAVTAR